MSGLSPYLTLVLVGFLPNEVWKLLGLVVARRLDEGSEFVTWARVVATAVLGGLIAKLVLFPTGALAAVPLPVRLTAIGAGLAAFLAVRRSIFAAILVGEVVLVAGTLVAR